MVMQKREELRKLQDEVETKKAQIVYDDPLEVENELEIAWQSKEQKLRELHQNKEQLASIHNRKEEMEQRIEQLKVHYE